MREISVDLLAKGSFHARMGGSLVELTDAASVDAAATCLFGHALDSTPLVSHSAAVWPHPESDSLATLQINGHQPKSDLDFLALHMARARAEAIIVTGKILRDEPTLRYDLRADPRWGDALVKWRGSRGIAAPPWLLVLTGTGTLDFAHPVFHSWVRPLIFTSDRTAARTLADSPVPVVADEAPTLRAAIQHLAQARDCQCISVEAGPSTTGQLYESPLRVDELLLSMYLGDSLDERARGASWLRLEVLRAMFSSETSAMHGVGDKRWRFHRFLRQPA